MSETGNGAPVGNRKPKQGGNRPRRGSKKAKRGGNSFIKGALGALVMLLLIAAVVLILHQRGVFRFPWEPQPIPNVGGRIMEGKMDMVSQQRIADENMLNIRLGASPKFESGDVEGSITIENVESNGCFMRVEIRLDDTQELIYDSGMMPPNSYIRGDKLLVPLPAGVYPATAAVLTYDLENQDEPLSTTGFAQTITVLN